MLEFRDGTRKNDKHLITHTNLHKSNKKLFSIYLTLLMLEQTMATLDSQDSPPSPFIIYYVPFIHKDHI